MRFEKRFLIVISMILSALVFSPAFIFAQNTDATSVLPTFSPEDYTLVPIATGFEQPIYSADAGDDSGRLFVITRQGMVWIVANGEVLPEPFLDLSEKLAPQTRTSAEWGMHGIVFDPDYAANGYFYVSYEGQRDMAIVERYSVMADDANRADPDSGAMLLSLHQPYMSHTLAQLVFGTDGYLYIGSGDGGPGYDGTADPFNLGQRLDELYGSILRIDVHPSNTDLVYGIPEDNPFVNVERVASEVWVYGLRNPHAFSFDSATGDMYIGDVGANSWEEINIVKAGSGGGENFGWAYYEGVEVYSLPFPYYIAPDPPQNPVFPALMYNRQGTENCAVIGGHVYHGERLPALRGVYVYADLCSGRLMGAWPTAFYLRDLGMLIDSDAFITAINVDAEGELLVVDYTGTIYRLAAHDESGETPVARLSESVREPEPTPEASSDE